MKQVSLHGLTESASLLRLHGLKCATETEGGGMGEQMMPGGRMARYSDFFSWGTRTAQSTQTSKPTDEHIRFWW